MVMIMVLSLAVTAQSSPDRHVRTTDPRILVLIDAGLSHSATFRRLVDILNESDVIVYVVPNLMGIGVLGPSTSDHVHRSGPIFASRST